MTQKRKEYTIKEKFGKFFVMRFDTVAAEFESRHDATTCVTALEIALDLQAADHAAALERAEKEKLEAQATTIVISASLAEIRKAASDVIDSKWLGNDGRLFTAVNPKKLEALRALLASSREGCKHEWKTDSVLGGLYCSLCKATKGQVD